MGLTVHFKLAALAGCNAAQAKRIVESMRRVAGRYYIEGLADRVHPITSDPKTLRRFGCDWLLLPVPGENNTSTGVEARPTAGFLFRVDVGADCEPLWLGLCQYPFTVRFPGREMRTKKSAGLAAGWFQQNAICQSARLGTFSALPLHRGEFAGRQPDAGTARENFGRGRLLAAPFAHQIAPKSGSHERAGGRCGGRAERSL